MTHSVLGAGGTRLAVRTAGDPAAPPIVFVHGWAQSSRCWAAQFADPALAVAHHLIAVDLRGHGESDVPDSGYDESAVWAEDLAAVLAFAGVPAVLVGWSYGGLVITDYVRERGCADLAAIVLVGAITEIGKGHPGGRIGPAMAAALPGAFAEDPAVAIPAVASLTVGMTAEPVAGALAQSWLGDSLRVPPAVRKALFRRDVASADVLASITVPTTVVHGTADAVVDPAGAEFSAGKIPGATLRWFPRVGHAPFAERVDEFNGVLRQAAPAAEGRKG
ncbi:alpha/beta fold hydrolase [Actinokineospora globicatena]|uniref:alpha/beta fold hydrolase n=1 Tax=Actinokineospora globicatena TaxID=103729 RepID=UPI0020A4F42F|nr:alpha/beta hydrolase [Actinokineospora globicatena]GLW76686.1 alpha/beta hydrolase [Actinokineospora globicatena]GLW83519.1 alpha/beta hydrolase [Actinokineospora globicatena]